MTRRFIVLSICPDAVIPQGICCDRCGKEAGVEELYEEQKLGYADNESEHRFYWCSECNAKRVGELSNDDSTNSMYCEMNYKDGGRWRSGEPDANNHSGLDFFVVFGSFSHCAMRKLSWQNFSPAKHIQHHPLAHEHKEWITTLAIQFCLY